MQPWPFSKSEGLDSKAFSKSEGLDSKAFSKSESLEIIGVRVKLTIYKNCPKIINKC